MGCPGFSYRPRRTTLLLVLSSCLSATPPALSRTIRREGSPGNPPPHHRPLHHWPVGKRKPSHPTHTPMEKTLQAEKPFLYHVGSRFWAFWHLLIAEFYEEVILLPAPPYSPLAYLAPSHRKRPTDPADSLHRALCHRMDPLPLETVPLLSPSNPLCLGYGPRIRRSPSGTKPIHGQLPYPLPHRWTGHLIPPAAPA